MNYTEQQIEVVGQVMRILALPEEVVRQQDRQEVFRAWIDGGMLSISICNSVPESYGDDAVRVWGILISDVFHHVVDAIVLQTAGARVDVQRTLRRALSEVSLSERGARRGTLKTVSDRLSEIPVPDVSDDENCVEIARIVLVPDSIRVMVLVGMWLPDDEESVWGNLLYDFSILVAETLVSELDSATLRAELLDEVFDRIDNPARNSAANITITNKRMEETDRSRMPDHFDWDLVRIPSDTLMPLSPFSSSCRIKSELHWQIQGILVGKDSGET